jgi:hypothetical protein
MSKMWALCVLIIVQPLIDEIDAIQVDCVANNFTIAPGAEMPYAYRTYTSIVTWNTSRQFAQGFHSECDLAVVRNQATLTHLQVTGFQRMLVFNPTTTCGGFWMGLQQLSTNSIPQGGWYWTDGVFFDPWNTSDSRWNTAGSTLPRFGLGRVGAINYGSACNSWSSSNGSNSA